MNTSRRSLLKCGTLSTVGLMFARNGFALTKLKVTGEVLDKRDSPISSVLVTLYRDEQKIDEVTTGPDGKYSVSFEQGEPLKTVRYERTGYVVGVVSDICGRRDHTISKTLYSEGDRQNLLEGLSSLSALERVFYLDLANKVSVPELRDKYGLTIKTLQTTLPGGPPSFKERYSQVARLYGLSSLVS